MAWKCFRQISAWPLPIKFGARTFSGHVWKEDPFFNQLPEVRIKRCGRPTVDVLGEEQKLLVIQPDPKEGPMEVPYVPADFKLDEAVSLVEAVTGWTVHEKRIDPLRKPHNKFLFGKGKIAELQKVAKTLPISGVFINTPKLTPFQHEALEELFEKDVFDRFGIVLKIFKERARTHEAKIQVELAEIPYLKSRLATDVTDTDHQKGGGGDTALHIAKQNLAKREKMLKEKLVELRKRYHVTAIQRMKHHNLPTVAVVGYTNAGKTTLVRALSRDEAMQPKDMLFATLDTTMHSGKLPSGMKVLYLDTIGFISELPHELIESFQSTLEEVIHADLIVHIRDASHPLAYAQKVLNKVDKVDQTACPLPEGPRAELHVSATKGQGIQELQCRIEAAVMRITNQKLWKVIVPASSAALSWLHHEATVTSVEPVETQLGNQQFQILAILSESNKDKLVAKFGDIMLEEVTTFQQ
ncbi:hypothetical protein EMCRGX_G014205 [Ephydatia muelleri]